MSIRQAARLVLADQLGKSEDALYQLLRRLRLELKRCVELGLTEEGGAV